MKKFLLTCAALALPTLAQAADLPLKSAPAAYTDATGYIEIYGGWASTRFEESDSFFEGGSFNSTDKGGVIGGAGRGNYWIGRNMSIQLDVQAEGTSYDFFSGPTAVSNSSSHDYLVGGHVNWRDPSRGLFGAFAGIGDVNATRHAVFGGEGQMYWNQFTFYLQGGYDTTTHRAFCGICEGAADINAWFVRATTRYYFTPNIRLEGTVLYADGEQNPSSFFIDAGSFQSDFNTWLWEAKAEWKMDHNPFAFFFKYRGSRTSYSFSCSSCNIDDSAGAATAKITDNRFLVGLRMYMGEKSLQLNDRDGTTLDIIAPLAAQSGPLYNSGGSSELTITSF